MIRPYLVNMVTQTSYNYTVDANTEEEAVSIAEAWLQDGEYGMQVIDDIFDSAAILAEET